MQRFLTIYWLQLNCHIHPCNFKVSSALLWRYLYSYNTCSFLNKNINNKIIVINYKCAEVFAAYKQSLHCSDIINYTDIHITCCSGSMSIFIFLYTNYIGISQQLLKIVLKFHITHASQSYKMHIQICDKKACMCIIIPNIK